MWLSLSVDISNNSQTGGGTKRTIRGLELGGAGVGILQSEALVALATHQSKNILKYFILHHEYAIQTPWNHLGNSRCTLYVIYTWTFSRILKEQAVF